MIRFEPRVVKRFFEPLDRFLKIRVFTAEGIDQLLGNAEVHDRRSFEELVLNACVIGYNDEVLPALAKVETFLDLRGKLYELCVSVNPGLDIRKISIPVPEDPRSSIHLFERKGLQPSPDPAGLRSIDARLKSRIVGQDEAITAVSRAIRKAIVGFRDHDRPVASFFFVGQTGVGKTETAKALSDILYGGRSRMIRIDCSEYALPHEYAKLLGSPPGYVGYDEGGQLSERVRRTGGSFLILFDEIEKSDSKLHHLLLQIMDEGTVTDSKGRPLDFKNAIVILTSNVGSEEIERLRNRIGFAREREAVKPEVLRSELLPAIRDRFRPEFINRLTDIILFNPIRLQECVCILERILEDVRRNALRIPLKLSFRKRVPKLLAEKGYRPEWGARELRRTVEREIEAPLSELFLEEKIHPGDRVVVRVRRDRLVFTRN